MQKQAETRKTAYQQKIDSMEKLDLLNEMVEFQEERSLKGELSHDMVVRGRVLFAALEDTADTAALRALTRSYKRHLDAEYVELRKNQENRRKVD